MDFAFSEEQEMLRSQARSFLGDKLPIDKVVELAESDTGWDPGSLEEMAGLGWIGLSVAEEHGGAGMTFLEEAVVFEELGRALYPGPYFSTVALALPLLVRAPELLEGALTGEKPATLAWAEPGGPHLLSDLAAVSTKAESQNGGWKLTGEKRLVPDLSAARTVAVVAASSDGVGIWALERDAVGATFASSATLDATRPYGALTLAGAPAQILVEPGDLDDVVRTIELRALAALAMEASGLSQRVIEMTLEHVTTRHQFDKPIGTYQAVSHQVVDGYVETELARSLAYWAAWCVAEGDGSAGKAVAAAKAAAGDAAVYVCERAIQVHGGIGFTWEHPLHRYYKRAQWIASFGGWPQTHRAAVASSLLD